MATCTMVSWQKRYDISMDPLPPIEPEQVPGGFSENVYLDGQNSVHQLKHSYSRWDRSIVDGLDF